MSIFNRALIAGLIIFLPFAAAFPSGFGGNSSLDFLSIAADPDSIALGDSILSRSKYPSNLISNPAALACNYQPMLSFANTFMAGDIRYNFAGIAVPLKFGVLGVAASYLDYGSIQGYDANYNQYVIPESGDTAVVLNYAIPVKSDIPVLTQYGSAGASVKFIHSDLAGYASDNALFDFGGVYNLPFVLDGLSAGLALKNWGGSAKYYSTADNAPSSVNLAIRYDYPAMKGLFAVVDTAVDSENTYYSAGAGISPISPLSLRCGWRLAQNYSAASGFSFGLAFEFNNIALRYSLSPLQDISQVHTVALDFVFDSFTRPEAAYDHYLSHYFEVGREQYDNKDYIAARATFEDILSVYPGHAQSIEYLLKIKSALDDMEQRQQVRIDRWLRKALVALDRNDIIQAKQYFSLVINIDQENADALDGLKKIRKLLGDLENPEEQRVDKERIIHIWDSAVSYYNKGDYVVAKEKFQEVLNADPNNEEAAKYLNDIYNQLNKISALQVNDLYNKGIEYFGSGNYSEAKKYFSAVLISNPERQDAQDYAAECQKNIDEAQKKSRAEDHAVNKQVKVKNDIEAAYFSALKFYQNGDYEQAIKAFTKSRDLASQNDFKKYEESSKRYIGNARNALAEKQYKFGYELYKANKLEEAAEAYTKALDYNIEFVEAKIELTKVNDQLAQNYYELGMKAFSAGDTEKAKELFRKSLSYKFDKIESLRALERINEVR